MKRMRRASAAGGPGAVPAAGAAAGDPHSGNELQGARLRVPERADGGVALLADRPQQDAIHAFFSTFTRQAALRLVARHTEEQKHQKAAQDQSQPTEALPLASRAQGLMHTYLAVASRSSPPIPHRRRRRCTPSRQSTLPTFAGPETAKFHPADDSTPPRLSVDSAGPHPYPSPRCDLTSRGSKEARSGEICNLGSSSRHFPTRDRRSHGHGTPRPRG
jgi:hypothetical protein